MIRRKPWILLLFCAAFAAPVSIRAQGSGGSGYSRYGIGDLEYFGSARSLGMGGAGLAVLTPDEIDRSNPAAWTQINRTHFSVGVLYEGLSTTDGSSSAYRAGTRFNGFMVAFPIAPASGIVGAAGVIPVSRVNYNVIVPGQEFSTQYWGDGGLSIANLGLSASPVTDVHIGARLNYYFGTLNYATQQTYSSTQYSEVIRSTEMRGLGGTFGVVYDGAGKLLNLAQGNALRIGATLTTTSYLNTEVERFFTYNTINLVTRDTVPSADGTLRLPFAVAAGVSYEGQRVTVATDVIYRRWSEFTVDGVSSPDLRDGVRFAAGSELLPKRESSAPFTQRTAYRLGVYYDASYYLLKGQPVNEIGVTAGLGFPLPGNTKLNIAGSYARRGSTDFGLQKDSIIRFSISLSGAETWFLRPEEE